MASARTTEVWKKVPLTDEDWTAIEQPFLRRSPALAIIRKLREWQNTPIVVDWIYGKAEHTIAAMNRTLKVLGLSYKFFNTNDGNQSRAKRKYFTEIYSMKK